jgi:hypothetical protein
MVNRAKRSPIQSGLSFHAPLSYRIEKHPFKIARKAIQDRFLASHLVQASSLHVPAVPLPIEKYSAVLNLSYRF